MSPGFKLARIGELAVVTPEAISARPRASSSLHPRSRACEALGDYNEGSNMTKRIQKLVMAVAALAALALGGAVFAQAQSAPSAEPPPASVDRDNVQSGDQTTPDRPAAATSARTSHAHVSAVRAASSATPTGGDTGQSGDQTTPDRPGSANEQPGAENPETGAGSESAPSSDGPGGHADEATNASADHQFQGNE